MGSASAVNEISRSKKRYELQDKMLRGFASHPNSTAKEVCRVIDLQYEQYCDGPKRVWDLKKLGKLEVTGERKCRVTHKKAEIYRVSEGACFCGGEKGLVCASVPPVGLTGSVASGAGMPESVADDLNKVFGDF